MIPSGSGHQPSRNLCRAAAARARIARVVAEMRPTGSVLEIACGAGMWTEALAAWAETVTGTDVAPEALAIARDRVWVCGGAHPG